MEKNDYELINRLDDFIDLAMYKNVVSTTRFLNPYEQSLAVGRLKNAKGIKYKIDGGYENSERCIIAIYPNNEYMQPENYLAAVKINFTKYDIKYLNHRMILGSVLSLGISRDGVGDIILDKDCALLIATKKMAEYISDNLSQVARARITADYIDDVSSVKLNLKEPITISGTTASLRIDSVLALALKISRAKACELINERMVYVNWQLVSKPTLQIEENQTITVRKKGRIILKHIGNMSKKNRIRVELDVII